MARVRVVLLIKKEKQVVLRCFISIYLCEHRNHGGSRRVVVTLQGQSK